MRFSHNSLGWKKETCSVRKKITLHIVIGRTSKCAGCAVRPVGKGQMNRMADTVCTVGIIKYIRCIQFFFDIIIKYPGSVVNFAVVISPHSFEHTLMMPVNWNGCLVRCATFVFVVNFDNVQTNETHFQPKTYGDAFLVGNMQQLVHNYKYFPLTHNWKSNFSSFDRLLLANPLSTFSS